MGEASGAALAAVDDPGPSPEEVILEGADQLSFFDVGGKKAQSGSIKLVGGKIALVQGTAFKKGTTITGTFTAVVNEVGQKDTHDPKTGQPVSCEQRHSARITDLQIN